MNQFNIPNTFFTILKSKYILNSFWGVIANVLQNIFFSIFFIIVARQYDAVDFSSYILANTIYGLVLAFSSLGLGQWFIRKLLEEVNKEILIHQFFKLQCIIGVIFYVLNVLIVYFLYENPLIRELSILIGINVIFDNIIYVIKHINIAQLNQKKTLLIQTVESLLKLILGTFILFTPISIRLLTLILIILRFLTLNVFLQIGTDSPIRFSYFMKASIDLKALRVIVANNWPFIIIGSVSVLFWKIGNMFIANYLTLSDVAHYEISFKLFSMAEVIPVIITTTIFPIFLKKLKDDRFKALKFYHKIFLGYTLYGFLAFTFIYSFSDQIIPWLFGENYVNTITYCKGMFLTMLIFPTAILQANFLVALHHEKLDMWFNIISLILNILISIIGLFFIKSISVINFAIFASFICFHLLQDHILIRYKLIRLKHVIRFYTFLIISVIGYYFMAKILMPVLVFVLCWIAIIIFFYFYLSDNFKRKIRSFAIY